MAGWGCRLGQATAGPRQAAAYVCSPTECACCALSNPGLRELPAELGQLGNLWQLDIEDLNISNVPAEIRKEGRASSASPGKGDPSLVVKDLGWEQLSDPWRPTRAPKFGKMP